MNVQTPQQFERARKERVRALLKLGATRKTIAAELGVSVRTAIRWVKKVSK